MTMNKQVVLSEETSLITLLYGNAEYDKLFQNMNEINRLNRKKFMNHKEYNHVEQERNNMHIILEFPKEPEKEEHIKREVKGILSNILQEHITKIS